MFYLVVVVVVESGSFSSYQAERTQSMIPPQGRRLSAPGLQIVAVTAKCKSRCSPGAQSTRTMQVKPKNWRSTLNFLNFERHGRKASIKIDRKSMLIRLQISDFTILLESKSRSNEISSQVALSQGRA